MLQYPSKSIPSQKLISLLIVVSILLGSYFFAIRGISQEMIRRDELTTLGHIGALEFDSSVIPITETITSITELSEQHPPLYFILANLWGRVFSYHPTMIKLFAVFFGLLAMATLFRLSVDIGGRTVGYYSIFIASTSVLFLFYTHDIRQYTLALFLTGITLLLYLRVIRTPHVMSRMQFGLLTITAAGMMYTHYSTIFILIPIGLYHILFVSKTKLWWQVASAFVLAGVLFLPWLPTVIAGLGGHTLKVDAGRKTYMTVDVLADVSSRFFGNGNSFLSILLMALFVVSVIVNMRGSRTALFYAVATTITILILNEIFELVAYIRYVIVFIIPFGICAGYGLSYLHRWRFLSWIPIIVCVGWIVSGTAFTNSDERIYQTQMIVPQYYVEFNRLIPLLYENDALQPSDAILVPVVRHYGLMRASKHGKKSIFEYYMSRIDMPYTIIYSGILSRGRFVLEDVWQGVEGYSTIMLTYPLGDLYEIRKFQRQIKATYTLCQTVEYGIKSLLEIYVINEQVDDRCTT